MRQFEVSGSKPIAMQLLIDGRKFATTVMSAVSMQAPAPNTPPSELDPESFPPSPGPVPLLLVLPLPLLLVLPLPPLPLLVPLVPLPVPPLLLLALLALLLVAPSPIPPLLPLLPDPESVGTPESGVPAEAPLEPQA